MQFFILLLFALPFALGLYLLLAAAFHVPTYRATKVLLGAVRKNRKAAKNSDAILEELAAKLAKVLPISPYRQRKLTATLRSAELPMTAGQYLSLAIVKAGLCYFVPSPACFLRPSSRRFLWRWGLAFTFRRAGKRRNWWQGGGRRLNTNFPALWQPWRRS